MGMIEWDVKAVQSRQDHGRVVRKAKKRPVVRKMKACQRCAEFCEDMGRAF